jgi:hypothetical protein
VRFEDIEESGLYAIKEGDLRPFPFKVTTKDPDGAWVKGIFFDLDTGEPGAGSTERWVTSNKIVATWVDYTAQQAEKQRARKMDAAAAEATVTSIRDSLRALSVDTFFDIDLDRNCDVVLITLDPNDLATFTAELARGVRQITDLQDRLEEQLLYAGYEPGDDQ